MKRAVQTHHEVPHAGSLHTTLQQVGLRPTMARVGVLQVLQADPPAAYTADEVFRMLAGQGVGVSQGTVYRVLQELAHCSLLLRERHPTDADGKSRFTLAAKTTPASSCRLTCCLCRRTIAVADTLLSRQLDRVAKLAGFERGLCATDIAMTCHACA